MPLPRPTQDPSFVSSQVTEARRFFLNLTPSREPPITVVCGGCERLHPDYLVRRITFPFLAMEMVAEGEGDVTLEGRKFRLQPGSVFAYRPGVSHVIRNDPSAPMLKYYVDFWGRHSEKLLADSPLGAWTALQLSSAHEVLEIFELLLREGAGDTRHAPEICAALIPVLILLIGERAMNSGSAEPHAFATFQRAKRYITQRFAELKTVEEAAQACHVDAAYLSRLFRRFGHPPPYRFLMRLKMDRALGLLLDSRLMVKEVAAAMGFADAFHFSTAFKRIYGLSPDRFVKRSRGMI